MNKQEIVKDIETLRSIYPSQKEIRTGEYDHVADALDDAISTLEKQIPKLAELIETFGKFKCPSCGEMYDACYDEETGEPSLWFRYCPDCGQSVVTKDYDTDGRNWDE